MTKQEYQLIVEQAGYEYQAAEIKFKNTVAEAYDKLKETDEVTCPLKVNVQDKCRGYDCSIYPNCERFNEIYRKL